MADTILSSLSDAASNVVPQLASAISQAIPPEVFLWIKVLLIVMVMYFVILIIKNLIQAGTALRIRKISKSVEIIKNDVGFIAQQYNQQ
jgi:hypothetical protein